LRVFLAYTQSQLFLLPYTGCIYVCANMYSLYKKLIFDYVNICKMDETPLIASETSYLFETYNSNENKQHRLMLIYLALMPIFVPIYTLLAIYYADKDVVAMYVFIISAMISGAPYILFVLWIIYKIIKGLTSDVM
jgi:RsiW-degrading membrane proteinase PrsW (M82 family)